MTKAKYPRDLKITTETVNSLKTGLEELSGTLEGWLNCRKERLEAQSRLIQSCRNDEEINRYKAEGLLDFKGTSL
jgi:hypothetical protein